MFATAAKNKIQFLVYSYFNSRRTPHTIGLLTHLRGPSLACIMFIGGAWRTSMQCECGQRGQKPLAKSFPTTLVTSDFNLGKGAKTLAKAVTPPNLETIVYLDANVSGALQWYVAKIFN